MDSSKTILTKLFTEYYLTGAQAAKEGVPVAWITAFTPVEILRAMGIVCMYPESYAVVCAASKKSRQMIHVSGMESFTQDLCSYSLISFGTENYPNLPYGGLPKPDLLIVTNNQCGTTVLWFKLLAQKLSIPLFVIDYPSAVVDQDSIRQYIRQQHESLVEFVQSYTSASLDQNELENQIQNSRQACRLWRQIHELNRQVSSVFSAETIVNALFPIVAAKGAAGTCDYYQALIHENERAPKVQREVSVRLLWHGYPMWFLPKKYPNCFDPQFRIIINDYTLWWDLEYPDNTNDLEALIQAYSNTYLNWPVQKQLDWIESLIKNYSIDGVILHANRSCRRALADIIPLRDRLREKAIPSVIIESDMANPDFYSDEQVKLRIESFKEVLQTS